MVHRCRSYIYEVLSAYIFSCKTVEHIPMPLVKCHHLTPSGVISSEKHRTSMDVVQTGLARACPGFHPPAKSARSSKASRSACTASVLKMSSHQPQMICTKQDCVNTGKGFTDPGDSVEDTVHMPCIIPGIWVWVGEGQMTWRCFPSGSEWVIHCKIAGKVINVYFAVTYIPCNFINTQSSDRHTMYF